MLAGPGPLVEAKAGESAVATADDVAVLRAQMTCLGAGMGMERCFSVNERKGWGNLGLRFGLVKGRERDRAMGTGMGMGMCTWTCTVLCPCGEVTRIFVWYVNYWRTELSGQYEQEAFHNLKTFKFISDFYSNIEHVYLSLTHEFTTRALTSAWNYSMLWQ